MEVRQCTAEDIIDILENPWDVTKEELDNFGLTEMIKYEERKWF